MSSSVIELSFIRRKSDRRRPAAQDGELNDCVIEEPSTKGIPEQI